jgi:hypothetical protein
MLYESRSSTKTGSGQTYYLGRKAHKKGWRFDSRAIEIGYDTMEFNMPLIGCNMHTGVTTSHQWFEQWCAKTAENDANSLQRFVCGCLSRACLDTSESAHNTTKKEICIPQGGAWCPHDAVLYRARRCVQPPFLLQFSFRLSRACLRFS